MWSAEFVSQRGLNHGFAVVGAVVYPDARQLLTLGLDGVAKVWRVENEEFLCQGGAGLSALGISRFLAFHGKIGEDHVPSVGLELKYLKCSQNHSNLRQLCAFSHICQLRLGRLAARITVQFSSSQVSVATSSQPAAREASSDSLMMGSSYRFGMAMLDPSMQS